MKTSKLNLVIKNLCHHSGALCAPPTPFLRWAVVTWCLCVMLAAMMVVWVCCGQRMLKEASVVLRLRTEMSEGAKSTSRSVKNAFVWCPFNFRWFVVENQKLRPVRVGGGRTQAFKHGNLQDACNCMEQENTVHHY